MGKNNNNKTPHQIRLEYPVHRLVQLKDPDLLKSRPYGNTSAMPP